MYPSTMCKRNKELLYDLLLDAITPNTWWNDITIKPEENISEWEGARVILIDINGNFSVENFWEKIKEFYKSTIQMVIKQYGYQPFEHLMKKSAADEDAESMRDFGIEIEKVQSKLSDKAINDDLIEFIQYCCKNLFLFRVFTVEEFSAVAKSLPHFICENRSVRLIMIDGLHSFNHKNIKLNTEDISIPILSSEDFLNNKSELDVKFIKLKETNKQRKFKRYEHSMVESALNWIKEIQSKYGVTIITFTGKMYIRKVAKFQEDILRDGLFEGDEFKLKTKSTETDSWIEGTITTEDEVLRAKVREMSYNEILILKWDEEGSLKEQKPTHVSFLLIIDLGIHLLYQKIS